MSFAAAMRAGQVRPLRTPAYLAWVRTLPCATCGAPPPSECNHLVGYGLKGVGVKTDDYLVMPQCRQCHDLITRRRREWEKRHGEQWQYVAMTLLEAVHQGVLAESANR